MVKETEEEILQLHRLTVPVETVDIYRPVGAGEREDNGTYGVEDGRQYEKFCAEGRMLFISLWPAMAREPTKAELYDRCHQMGDIIVEGIGDVPGDEGEQIGSKR